METQLARFSRSLDALSGHLQNANNKPASDLLRTAHSIYEPAGYPTDKPLPRSAVKPTLSNDLIPKIAKVLRLLLGPVSELASRRPPATDWDASGLVAAFEIAAVVLMHPVFVSQLLPILPERPDTSRLFAQLSDEPLLQSLADWSWLAETVGWGLAEFRMDAHFAAAPAPNAQMRPKFFRARNTSYGGPTIFNFASNVTGSGGHSNVANLVSNSSLLVKSLVDYACKSSHASAAPRLPLLAATLHRTQLLAAVSSALRSAPALPFWVSGSPDGPVEAAAVAYASGLDTLSCTAEVLAKHLGGTAVAADAVARVLGLLSNGELQRLLLEAMERVAELYEEETGLASLESGSPHEATAPPPPLLQPAAGISEASGGGSGGDSGGSSGGGPATRRDLSGSTAAASTAAAAGTAEGAIRGSGGGWPLFDASVVTRMRPLGDWAGAVMRWELVRRTLATWYTLQHHRRVIPVLPSPRRLAPLAVRLNRALAMAPPPVPHDPGLQPLTPAELAKLDVGLALNDTMLLCQALLETLKRAGTEAAAPLLPGLHEAWAWGMAAAARRLVRAIKDAGSSRASAEVHSAVLEAQKILMRGQELMSNSLLDSRAGWPALSPALRKDVVRRLAGAGLLRSWDTALRLAADSGDTRLLGSAVSALLPSVELLMVPLLREAMRPQPPYTNADAAACSGADAPAAGYSFLLPPPVPMTDPWDDARELGWLVTAAKLVSWHGWEISGGRGSGGASSSWGFLSLRGALRSLALGPAGLPALLTELAAAAAGTPAGAHAGAGAGSGSPDPQALALLELVSLAARAVFTTSHLACAAADGKPDAEREEDIGDLSGYDQQELMQSLRMAVINGWAPAPPMRYPPHAGESAAPGASAEAAKGVLQCSAADVTALRSAIRLLPPADVLRAGPLLPLGAATAALRALAAKGGGGTVPDAVASAARRLAQSVVTALAELAAEPVLEPNVRAALAEPAGAETPQSVGAAEALRQPEPPALRWQPPSLDATAGMGVGEVAAAVAAFSPRSAKQLARLRAAAAEATASPAHSSPLLAAARGLLQAAVDPSAAAADPAVAALERMDRRRLAGLLPPPGCRLWQPTVLRVCCNPACGDLTGECEAGLKLRLCAGCEAARYCGAECQRQHWASGHNAECARLKRGSGG
ncbi:hypothetical protein GPECTOR_7g985 [Gonium pectorale]|uniref:MYND-type domain-containing protein n=1 Tax=Gonium pectorale TaxID=33097 RepID=A0A150GUJ5_GONPE|nr:hypothetical protein GPECTOR_7g985 [Gonium pectorale]|eukprot:KXZ53535.1 hypothetical protein GPECTOR_7g985 [Gonium pectorale]